MELYILTQSIHIRFLKLCLELKKVFNIWVVVTETKVQYFGSHGF